MPAKPDLASHSLIHFLDRFVYRNAKASSGALRGSSIMQPLAGGESTGVLVSNKTVSKNDSVNSEAFWRKKAEDIAVDEVFFHKYFNQIGKTKAGRKAPKEQQTRSDAGSGDDDDENEEEIWQALVESRPDVEGPSDDDSDLDLLDLDDSDSEEEVDQAAAVDTVVAPSHFDEDEESYEKEEAVSDAASDSDAEAKLFDEDEDDLVSESELFNKELEKAQSSAKDSEKESSRSRKKKMKALPTFASADDYANMLAQDVDEDF